MKLLLFLTALFIFPSFLIAQYEEPEKVKNPEERIFPNAKFDSIAAKDALAKGTATMKGVAFTRPRNNLGFKAPLADRIFANNITVELFPLTPYFQEWYDLKRKKENVKKNKIVYMDSEAYRYRLTCITNSEGEFTFPEMKPGKYILVGVLPYEESGSYNQYTGTGYTNYGTIDYYEKQYYTITHSDFLIEIVEVVAGEKTAKVKLK